MRVGTEVRVTGGLGRRRRGVVIDEPHRGGRISVVELRDGTRRTYPDDFIEPVRDTSSTEMSRQTP